MLYESTFTHINRKWQSFPSFSLNSRVDYLIFKKTKLIGVYNVPFVCSRIFVFSTSLKVGGVLIKLKTTYLSLICEKESYCSFILFSLSAHPPTFVYVKFCWSCFNRVIRSNENMEQTIDESFKYNGVPFFFFLCVRLIPANSVTHI